MATVSLLILGNKTNWKKKMGCAGDSSIHKHVNRNDCLLLSEGHSGNIHLSFFFSTGSRRLVQAYLVYFPAVATPWLLPAAVLAATATVAFIWLKSTAGVGK